MMIKCLDLRALNAMNLQNKIVELIYLINLCFIAVTMYDA